MKKLTAGIFAAILTVVTVNAAHANIASEAYVNEKTKDMVTTTELEGKADKSELEDKADKSDLEGKQDALTQDQLDAVNSGITAELVNSIRGSENCTDCVLKYNGSALVWEDITRSTTGE